MEYVRSEPQAAQLGEYGIARMLDSFGKSEAAVTSSPPAIYPAPADDEETRVKKAFLGCDHAFLHRDGRRYDLKRRSRFELIRHDPVAPRFRITGAGISHVKTRIRRHRQNMACFRIHPQRRTVLGQGGDARLLYFSFRRPLQRRIDRQHEIVTRDRWNKIDDADGHRTSPGVPFRHRPAWGAWHPVAGNLFDAFQSSVV